MLSLEKKSTGGAAGSIPGVRVDFQQIHRQRMEKVARTLAQ